MSTVRCSVLYPWSDPITSRKAVLTAHPDKGGSEAKMAAVNEAYEVLSNPGASVSYAVVIPVVLPSSRVCRAPPAVRQRRRPERPTAGWGTIPGQRLPWAVRAVLPRRQLRWLPRRRRRVPLPLQPGWFPLASSASAVFAFVSVSYAVSCLYAALVDAFVSGYLILSSPSLPLYARSHCIKAFIPPSSLPGLFAVCYRVMRMPDGLIG